MVVWQKVHQIVLVDYLCIKTGIDGRDRIAGIKTDMDGYPCFGVPGYRLPVRGTQTGKFGYLPPCRTRPVYFHSEGKLFRLKKRCRIVSGVIKIIFKSITRL